MILTVKHKGLFEIVVSKQRDATIVLKDANMIDSSNKLPDEVLLTAMAAPIDDGAFLLASLGLSVGLGRAISGPLFSNSYVFSSGLSFSTKHNYDHLLSDSMIKLQDTRVIIEGVPFTRVGSDIRGYGIYESIDDVTEQFFTTNHHYIMKEASSYQSDLAQLAANHVQQAILAGVSLNDAPAIALNHVTATPYKYFFMDANVYYSEQNNRSSMLDYIMNVKYPGIDDFVKAVSYASNLVGTLSSVSGAKIDAPSDIIMVDPSRQIEVNGLVLPVTSVDSGISPTKSKFSYRDDIATKQDESDSSDTYRDAVKVARTKVISTIREINSLKQELVSLQDNLSSYSAAYCKSIDAWELSNASSAVIRRQIEAILSAPVCNYQSNAAFCCVGDFIIIDAEANVNMNIDAEYHNKIFVPGDHVRNCGNDYITMYGVNRYPQCADTKSVSFPQTYLNNLHIKYSLDRPLIAPEQKYKPFLGKERIVVNATYGFERSKFSSLDVLGTLLLNKVTDLVDRIKAAIKNSAALEAQIKLSRDKYFEAYKEVQTKQARIIALTEVLQNNSNYQLVGNTKYVYDDDAIEVPFILLQGVHSQLTDQQAEKGSCYITHATGELKKDDNVLVGNNTVRVTELNKLSDNEGIFSSYLNKNPDSIPESQVLTHKGKSVYIKKEHLNFSTSEDGNISAITTHIYEIDYIGSLEQGDITLECDKGKVTFTRELVDDVILWTPIGYEFNEEFNRVISHKLLQFVNYNDVTMSYIRFMYGRNSSASKNSRPDIMSILTRDRICVGESLAMASGIASLIIGV